MDAQKVKHVTKGFNSAVDRLGDLLADLESFTRLAAEEPKPDDGPEAIGATIPTTSFVTSTASANCASASEEPRFMTR